MATVARRSDNFWRLAWRLHL